MTSNKECWVSKDPAVLARAQERYTALEQSLHPLVATVSDLEGDWNPRLTKYWNATLRDLTAVRTATQGVFQMFDWDQSRHAAPIPHVLTSFGHTIRLLIAQSKIEEAGILLTSYIQVCGSHEEHHLHQRQRVLKALQEVVKVTRDAIQEGRAL